MLLVFDGDLMVFLERCNCLEKNTFFTYFNYLGEVPHWPTNKNKSFLSL